MSLCRNTQRVTALSAPKLPRRDQRQGPSAGFVAAPRRGISRYTVIVHLIVWVFRAWPWAAATRSSIAGGVCTKGRTGYWARSAWAATWSMTSQSRLVGR